MQTTKAATSVSSVGPVIRSKVENIKNSNNNKPKERPKRSESNEAEIKYSNWIEKTAIIDHIRFALINFSSDEKMSNSDRPSTVELSKTSRKARSVNVT